jgi:hypothetical protein
MSKMIGLLITLCLQVMLASFVMAADGQARRKIVPGKNFVLRVGQEVLTVDGKLKIKFLSVPEDSRCPKGVNCIWAGNARIVLQVGKLTGKPVILELDTNPRSTTHTAEGGFGLYQIKLIEVAPYPLNGQTIAPRSYAATLMVSKKIERSLRSNSKFSRLFSRQKFWSKNGDTFFLGRSRHRDRLEVFG